VIPLDTAALMLVVTAEEDPAPPKLAVITDGYEPLFAMIQSMAQMNHVKLPLPESARIFTACKVAAGASPYVALPTVPAQCVP